MPELVGLEGPQMGTEYEPRATARGAHITEWAHGLDELGGSTTPREYHGTT